MTVDVAVLEQEYLELLEQEQLAKARANPLMLAEVCRRPFELTHDPTWFQKEWVHAFQNYRNVLILAPRGAGKSKWVSLYVAWLLGNHPEARIIYTSMKDGMAQQGIQDIGYLIASEEYQGVFGDITTDKKQGTWSRERKTVKRPFHRRDPSLRATGAGSGIAGARADVLVFDDILDAENTYSELSRERMADWYRQTMIPILEEGDETWQGQRIMIGTRWSHLDLYGEILELFLDSRETAFTKVYQAYLPGGESYWPTKFPIQRLDEIKSEVGEIAFNCQYMNDPTGQAGTILRDEWLKYADQDYIDQAMWWPMYYGVDPAFTEKRTSDYTCIAKIRAMGNEAYFQDLIFVKTQGPDVVDLIKQHAVVDRPRRIMVESNAAQVMIAQALERQMGKPIEKGYSSKDKVSKFRGMSAHFESGRVKLNPDIQSGLPYFRKCWIEFDRGHDDALDAAYFALQAAGLTSGKKLKSRYQPSVAVRRHIGAQRHNRVSLG